MFFRKPNARIIIYSAFLLAAIVTLQFGKPQPANARSPQTDTSGWFPFTIPWDSTTASSVGASDLLIDIPGRDPATIIDTRGYVTTDANGHFVYSNSGERARFWGVNLTFSANFPPCPDFPPQAGDINDVNAAEKLAVRLAEQGFNAVRLHHMDNWGAPSGIWLNAAADTQELDPTQLGRVDCLIYELKQNGIYVDLNFHVSREFVSGDGVTDADAFTGENIIYNKGVLYFDPVMVALQKQFAEQLLTHTNPYTGLTYANDPVIFTTETTNEDSLFISYHTGQLDHDPQDSDSLPAFYGQQLDGWTTLSGTGPTINRINNGGFESGLDGWYTYVDGTAQANFSMDGTNPAEGTQSLKIDVLQTDPPNDWFVQLGQVDLAVEAGKAYRLSFAVRADQPTNIWGSVRQDSAPWNTLGWDTQLPVTTNWVTHTIEFTATETALGRARISFDVGQTALSLWFDDFNFHEVDAFRGWNGWLEDEYGTTAAIDSAWTPPPPADTSEMLANGSFESGIGNWQTEVFSPATASTIIDTTTATDGAQSAQITAGGTGTNWEIQFWQPDVGYTEGQFYKLIFDAKTDVPGEINFVAKQNHSPWLDLGFNDSAEIDSTWQTYELIFRASQTDANARIGFVLGQSVRTIWIDNVSLKAFSHSGLAVGESLEAGSIIRPPRNAINQFSAERMHDFYQFLYETQLAYLTDMRDTFSNDFGSQALNTGTANLDNNLLDSQSSAALDFVDNHLYWDHPAWPNVPPWSSTGWVIHNQAWVNNPFNTQYGNLFDLAVTAVEGKPFTVTEVNTVFPNHFAAEGPLVIATFANLQDWDGIFMFDYSDGQLGYDEQMSRGYFTVAGNPIASGLMPVAARIFLGEQTAAAPALSLLPYTSAEIDASQRFGWAGSSSEYLEQLKGVDQAAAFGSRLRISDFDAPTAVTLNLPTPSGPIYSSGGGQLDWDLSNANRGLLTFDAPEAQGAVGFINGRTVTLGNMTLAVTNDSAEFAAITLQSRNSQPISTAPDLLLSIFTRTENTGIIWNASNTSINDNWGTAPTLIEPLQTTVTLTLASTSGLEIWALDASGADDHQLTFTTPSAGEVQFTANTGTDQTLWYSVRRPAVPTTISKIYLPKIESNLLPKLLACGGLLLLSIVTGQALFTVCNSPES